MHMHVSGVAKQENANDNHLTDIYVLFHLWFQAIYQASLGLCLLGQTYIQTRKWCTNKTLLSGLKPLVRLMGRDSLFVTNCLNETSLKDNLIQKSATPRCTSTHGLEVPDVYFSCDSACAAPPGSKQYWKAYVISW